jgi:hypothetical protein
MKENFCVEAAGRTGVNDTFYAVVHDYLRSRTAAQLASDGLIQLGDYIDLEGGLAVNPYHTGNLAAADNGYSQNQNNGAVNAANTPIPGGDRGTLLRLIVVGLNSFNAQGQYTGNGNGESAHLVFQFQNLSARHRMNETATNAGGYKDSEMRAYITGNFYTGLLAAGVPDGVIWGPNRYAANGGQSTANDADLFTDKIWLPTALEISGSTAIANTAYENQQNQARLEYYSNSTARIKYDSAGSADIHLQVSPSKANNTHFGGNHSGGGLATYSAEMVYYVAPVFCIR